MQRKQTLKCNKQNVRTTAIKKINRAIIVIKEINHLTILIIILCSVYSIIMTLSSYKGTEYRCSKWTVQFSVTLAAQLPLQQPPLPVSNMLPSPLSPFPLTTSLTVVSLRALLTCDLFPLAKFLVKFPSVLVFKTNVHFK